MNNNQDDRIIYTCLEGPGKELASILLSSAFQEASALFHQEVTGEEKETDRCEVSMGTATPKNRELLHRQGILQKPGELLRWQEIQEKAKDLLRRQGIHKKTKWDKERTFWSLVVVFGLVLPLVISTVLPGRSVHRDAEPVQQVKTELKPVQQVKTGSEPVQQAGTESEPVWQTETESEPVWQTETESEAVLPAKAYLDKALERIFKEDRRYALTTILI